MGSQNDNNNASDFNSRSNLYMLPYSWHEAPLLGFDFAINILRTASQGALLSQVSIVFTIHLALHLYLSPSPCCRWSLSSSLLGVTAALVLSGYILLVRLYCHSVQAIFNCKVPPRFLTSLAIHLEMLKPLEIIWRYLTFRFRVLPDIIVVGEVRCGTTTLCHHLSSMYGCHQPFCLWKHPELDKKETFYFVGHYLGYVDPLAYRMCFPLVLTRWIHWRILGRPFFTFEGCAQLLSSPSAPYLIAKAYKDAGQPPPVLVACVRDPIDQTLSWWNYENKAISWGKSMGLVDANSKIRTSAYPPKTLSEAFAFSFSENINSMYKSAEDLFCARGQIPRSLPQWAMTWPGGQLSGIGRNGCFAANILRYERVFYEEFGEPTNLPTMPAKSKLKYMNVVPLNCMSEHESLLSILKSLTSQINRRTCNGPSLQETWIRPRSEIHRNANLDHTRNFFIDTLSELSAMKERFSRDTRTLEDLCGVGFMWTTSASPEGAG